MGQRGRVLRALVAAGLLVGALGGCSNEAERAGADIPTVGLVPDPMLDVTGEPGEPVSRTYDAAAGDIVRMTVQPLPEQGCEHEFVLIGPDGAETTFSTLDPWSRLDAAGEWTWTFTPCAGTETAYTLSPTPTRAHTVELDGDAVALEDHGTYRDAATFIPPSSGRVVLTGKRAAVLGPNGAALAVFGDDRLVFEDGALANDTLATTAADQEESGRWSVVGAGDTVRLARPTTVQGEVFGGPITLWAREQGVAEYAVEFSVEDEMWLSAPLTGWPEDEALPVVSVEPVEGTDDVSRPGGGDSGLWHLAPGDYVARVAVRPWVDTGQLDLVEVPVTEVATAGDILLSTAFDGTPAVAAFELDGDHTLSVARIGSLVPWTLTWGPDEALEPCASTLQCTSQQRPHIPNALGIRTGKVTGTGYFVLASSDGHPHAVTLRIAEGS